MTIAIRFAAALIVFSVALSGCSKQTPVAADASEKPEGKPSEKEDDGSVENNISIEFSKQAYTFTLAEAAKGVRIDYTISVKHNIEGVVSRPQDDGLASDPGPSGLFPFEKLFGNGQSYSLRDIGLAPSHEFPARTIKKDIYPAVFEWDGRNWIGSSDFNNPKGEPFPPGSYTLEVRIVGEVNTSDGKKPYNISSSVPVKLTN